MQFHPKAFIKALAILAAFGVLLLLGLDARLGVIAILAVTAVDALSFLLPLGLGFDRNGRRQDEGFGRGD